ncbi:OmpW/AlkL family protein [Pseudogemmobacter faecipullorum]|uniref:Outer membrane beta-barrel protein n=1 Tax=Pseudogemmobacter faecipullorum TaxID=2755041 RepID=A0ABS8CL64_9RHOB|nr:OmpW family outer membrane protein [Pseudogemmobacter faecipullorum]MCB5410122.1 outer membrane beta-barrel protein [Pseudogemmobacter faecipullorum]
MKKSLLSLFAGSLIALSSLSPALAQEAGSLTLGFGLGGVMPKDNNGTLAGMQADIGNNIRPIVTLEYFIRDNIGIELLGAAPFKHKISLAGPGEIGETKHLPPTLSVNWHIPTGGALTPFLGLGVNYTKFFEERSGLGQLKIKDSFGLAATIGVDYAISDKSALRADLRYIDIDSDVYLDGAYIGKTSVDPLVTSISYVMKF